MEWISSLFFGSSIAHTVFTLAITIAIGIALGKIKIAGISLGITWILFVGIALSSFGMQIDPTIIAFVKEFGLILFVYSVGMQVGPSFFSSFKQGGMRLVGIATAIVLGGVLTAYIIHLVTGTPIPTMVGVLSGAVTNTPGLGAAQQAYADSTGLTDPTIAMGYAVAYPLGVVGIIISIVLLRAIFRIKLDKEKEALESANESKYAAKISIELTNTNLFGRSVQETRGLINRSFVVSRICRANGTIEIANANTVLAENDKMLIICASEDVEAIEMMLGHQINMQHSDWLNLDQQFISRRIIITQPHINGKTIGELRLRSSYAVNVTRVNRSGVDLIPEHNLELQIGDRLTVVGSEMAIDAVAKALGNSMRRLREPNLISIFLGIFLGVLVGSIPIAIPGMPQAVKLGLAGGPLIVAILISRFGAHYHLVTYTTMSANLMLREVGISLFLAAVGISAGEGFIDTVVNQGGYMWVLYGIIITMLPILLVGIFARKVFKLNYFTLMGVVAGSMTNPPALAYSNATAGNDVPAVSYATVYPFMMFLRVLTAQLFVLFGL
ncbi:MAG: putative transporter [Rikenellaceae bacterium]|nr:putative transporter [Rikenellaceae bacterium]MBP3612099.1 putative transporter [Rikenellaceae bacterium]MBP3683115.1 putative transporter [Rikenellaceae bacterium]MBQ8745591.1 putative transporter [Rikenellaceae bacterium]MBR2501011.1 putative transporter [Rikenellaceae bacterium]